MPIVEQGYADSRLGLLVLDVIRMKHVSKVFFKVRNLPESLCSDPETT